MCIQVKCVPIRWVRVGSGLAGVTVKLIVFEGPYRRHRRRHQQLIAGSRSSVLPLHRPTVPNSAATSHPVTEGFKIKDKTTKRANSLLNSQI